MNGRRIFLRLPSWLGDFVMAEPVVRAAVAPDGVDRVTLAAPGRLLELFAGRFERAERRPVDGDEDWRSYAGHDLALFLNGSLRSPLAAWRARVPRRIGWGTGARAPLLTDVVRPAREAGGVAFRRGTKGAWPRVLPRPFGSACVELALLAGITVTDRRPRLAPTAEAAERVRRRVADAGLSPDEPFVVVGVGARPGSAKGYPAERWAAVVDGLYERVGLPAFLLGAPGEELAVRAAAECAKARAVAVVDPPADISELVAWCARARLLLCADGGARHVASAVGTPTVVLFGPTDPRHTADHLAGHASLRTPVPCGPCHLERCPIEGEGHHACMLGIGGRDIVDAAVPILDRVSGL